MSQLVDPAVGRIVGLDAGRAHVSASIMVVGDADRSPVNWSTVNWVDGARLAAAEHAERRGGRAMVYPGAERLTGSLTVGEALERSAIERVVTVTGEDASPETVLHTLDHVRPMWMDGRLTLVTRPAPAGSLTPFELRNPTPCCADH
jgi:hypothetical protein